MAAQISPTVLVASDDPTLLDEVIRFTEEIPHWRLVPPARSRIELIAAIEAHDPDVVVVSEGILVTLQSQDMLFLANKRAILLGRSEESGVLKRALKLGVAGFVLWPRERGELRALVEAKLEATPSRSAKSGRLTAVWGPKGGSGASVIAAHLAGASARAGRKTLLIDLDLDHGDQLVVLPPDGDTKTVLDLLRVANELTPSVIDQIAYSHPAGFKVIYSPASPGESDLVKSADLASALRLARESTGHLIVDVASGVHELAVTVSEEATTLVLVVTCDVLSLKRGRDGLRLLRSSGIDPSKISVIVNAYTAGGEISVKDVEAVLGRPVALTVRGDAGLATAPNRGELAPSGLRLLDPLARRVAGIREPARVEKTRLFSRR